MAFGFFIRQENPPSWPSWQAVWLPVSHLHPSCNTLISNPKPYQLSRD